MMCSHTDASNPAAMKPTWGLATGAAVATAAVIGSVMWYRKAATRNTPHNECPIPKHVRPFHTVYGRNLLAELKPVCPSGHFLIVTMRDLVDVLHLKSVFGDTATIHCVESLEAEDLDRAVAVFGTDMRVVVGIGGGQAIDVAKYFAWMLPGRPLLFQVRAVDCCYCVHDASCAGQRCPLGALNCLSWCWCRSCQVPTALTVDAAWGHRAAVRYSGVVRYVGFAVPEAVYIDFDIIRKAPRRLNMSGVGDVLCYHTAHADWRIADAAGHAGIWQYDAAVAAEAAAVVDYLVANLAEVRKLSDAGIRALVSALSYGGAAYHAHGWNPRPVEGFDHIFFYALEYHTGQHFIHGFPVLLGVFLGSLLQGNRPAWVLKVITRLDIDIRPTAMGVTWDQVKETLLGMRAFAQDKGYMFTVANAEDITEEWVEKARAQVEAAYETQAAAV